MGWFRVGGEAEGGGEVEVGLKLVGDVMDWAGLGWWDDRTEHDRPLIRWLAPCSTISV